MHVLVGPMSSKAAELPPARQRRCDCAAGMGLGGRPSFYLRIGGYL